MSTLRLSGALNSPREFSVEDLDRLDRAERVEDAAKLGYKKGGKAVYFRALVRLVRPTEEGKWITFCAPTDPFFASIPLEALHQEGLVIYANSAGEKLDPEKDGPFRFFIPDAGKCGTEARDECLNVKHLREISFGPKKGRDTRPEDSEEHRKLHQK